MFTGALCKATFTTEATPVAAKPSRLKTTDWNAALLATSVSLLPVAVKVFCTRNTVTFAPTA